jgi:hypothetical protein
MADKKEHAEPAFLAEPPVVVVNGREYRMRRLGVQDTFRLARIIATGAARLGSEVSRLDLTPETVVMLLIAGVPYAERETMEVLADILGVSVKELSDPDLFPMDTLIDIAAKLAEHQDLRAFFEKLAALIQTMPSMRTFTGASTVS